MSFEKYLPFTQKLNNNETSNNLQQHMLTRDNTMY